MQFKKTGSLVSEVYARARLCTKGRPVGRPVINACGQVQNFLVAMPTHTLTTCIYLYVQIFNRGCSTTKSRASWAESNPRTRKGLGTTTILGFVLLQKFTAQSDCRIPVMCFFMLAKSSLPRVFSCMSHWAPKIEACRNL